MGKCAVIMLAHFCFMNPIEIYKNHSLKNIVAEIEGVWHIEEWEKIEYYDNYMVSSFGRVKKLRHFNNNGTARPQRILKISLSGRYLRFHFRKKGIKPITVSIHRVVCKAFHENPENKPQVNHKDTIKWNNFYLNVEWSTQSENIVHAQYAGIYPFAKPKPPLKKKEEKNMKGGIHKPIIDLNTGIFYTSEELANRLNTKQRYINRLLSEERKPNTTQYRYA